MAVIKKPKKKHRHKRKDHPDPGGRDKKPPKKKPGKKTTTTGKTTPADSGLPVAFFDQQSPDLTQPEPEPTDTGAQAMVNAPGVYSTGTGAAPTYHFHRAATYSQQYADSLAPDQEA